MNNKKRYEIWFVTDNNEEILFKSLIKISTVKKWVKKLIDKFNSEKDSKITEFYVLDTESEKELFIYYCDEEGNWNVDLDELKNIYSYGSAYQDTLLNRFYYSLTNSKPENFLKYAEKSLVENILQTESGVYIKDGEEAAYCFTDDGDVNVNITLNENEIDSKDKSREWIKKVCEAFKVNMREIRKDVYKIFIPDQAKYYEYDED